MVLKGSGLQPCLYINILGGGVCVCVYKLWGIKSTDTKVLSQIC